MTNLSTSPKDFTELKDAYEKLLSIIRKLNDPQSDQNPNVILAKLDRWEESTHAKLKKFIGPDEAKKLELIKASIYFGEVDVSDKIDASCEKYSVYMKVLLESIQDGDMPVPIQTLLVSNAAKSNKIFIGHGRTKDWLELQVFLQDRLNLLSHEFNSVSPAGYAIKERLQEILNTTTFAFLIMTSEDVQTDGSHRARENVVHEIGLFQGKLGFDKAIVLLEEGCSEFSNIHGLNQIRFPKGNIGASFEEIRKVLEREKLIGPHPSFLGELA